MGYVTMTIEPTGSNKLWGGSKNHLKLDVYQQIIPDLDSEDVYFT